MKTEKVTRSAPFLLRLGLAFTFAYAAIASFYAQQNWAGFFPRPLVDLVPIGILLAVFSIYELALAAWLLSNRKTFYAACLSALTLVGIIVFNFGALDIVFRDAGLFFAAAALAALSYRRK